MVPIVALVFHGIELDMLFAQVGVRSVNDDFNIMDDAILRGVDGSSLRSLRGPRDTELVRLLVPK